MAAETPPDRGPGGQGGALLSSSTAKTDPDLHGVPPSGGGAHDPDPERSADREEVALAMVTDLTKATGIRPPFHVDGVKVMASPEVVTPDMLRVGQGQGGGQGSAMLRKKQRKRPREDEKICLVCGDKALAHNFDAITCESCKAFFRRNALRNERGTCLFTGDCEITIQTRRFCSACRLKKCFSVGMKADLILDDSERRARMEKVSENRAKRLAKDGGDFGDAQVGSTMVGIPADFPPTVRQSTPSPSLPSPLSTVLPSNNNNNRLEEASSSFHLGDPSPSSSQKPYHPHHQNHNQRQQHQQQHQQHQQHQQQHQQYRRRSVEGRGNINSSSNLSTLHDVLTAATVLAENPRASPALSVPTTAYHPSVLTPPPPPPPPTVPPAAPSHQLSYLAPHMVESKMAAPAPSQPPFQHVPRDLLPSDPHMYWRLSDEEKTILTQLSSAYQGTIMTLPERVTSEGAGLLQNEQGQRSGLRSIEHVFESSEKNMRQLINFVQRLGDFHMLREDDKIAVLQASCIRSMILRWTGLYVVERGTWLTQFGECSVEDTSRLFGQGEVIQELAAFCQVTKSVLKNDVTLFVLTHCLLLFDAREPHLVDRQLINTFRDKYLVLLKHYLESEYSFLFSERYLQAVLERVTLIRPLAERCMGIMKEFQHFIPPLTKQLLNLQEPQ